MLKSFQIEHPLYIVYAVCVYKGILYFFISDELILNIAIYMVWNCYCLCNLFVFSELRKIFDEK